MTANLVWHYTVGTCLAPILATGIIDRSREYVPRGQRHVVWFSSHPTWEPTATKMFTDRYGRVRLLTLEELRIIGKGLVRFGVPAASLIPWPLLAAKARISRPMQQGLERAGLEQGANPADWFGCFKPVPINTTVLEFEKSPGLWGPAREVA